MGGLNGIQGYAALASASGVAQAAPVARGTKDQGAVPAPESTKVSISDEARAKLAAEQGAAAAA